MAGVRTCLAFDGKAEEAVDLYVSTIKNSRILETTRAEGVGPELNDKLVYCRFELDGVEYAAMDGGPTFTFAEGTSLMVTVDSQEELDETWEKLTSGGGEGGRCGWLKDRFGVSWQVIPAALGEMMGDSANGNPAKVMEALMQMDKIDIATLRKAHREPATSVAG